MYLTFFLAALSGQPLICLQRKAVRIYGMIIIYYFSIFWCDFVSRNHVTHQARPQPCPRRAGPAPCRSVRTWRRRAAPPPSRPRPPSRRPRPPEGREAGLGRLAAVRAAGVACRSSSRVSAQFRNAAVLLPLTSLLNPVRIYVTASVGTCTIPAAARRRTATP